MTLVTHLSETGHACSRYNLSFLLILQLYSQATNHAPLLLPKDWTFVLVFPNPVNKRLIFLGVFSLLHHVNGALSLTQLVIVVPPKHRAKRRLQPVLDEHPMCKL